MKCPNGGTLCLGLIIGTTYGSIYRRFSRSVQLGGLGSVLDWRSHQGIRRKMKRSLVNFCQDGKGQLLISGLDVFLTGQKCPYLHANS